MQRQISYHFRQDNKRRKKNKNKSNWTDDSEEKRLGYDGVRKNYLYLLEFIIYKWTPSLERLEEEKHASLQEILAVIYFLHMTLLIHPHQEVILKLIDKAHGRELQAKKRDQVEPGDSDPNYFWRLTSGFLQDLKDLPLPGLDKIVRACSWLFRNYYNIGNTSERIMLRHWYAMDQTFNAGVYSYPVAFLSIMIRHFEIMSLAKLSKPIKKIENNNKTEEEEVVEHNKEQEVVSSPKQEAVAEQLAKENNNVN